MKNKEIDKYIGSRLKLKRKELKISQESLSFDMELSPQQIQKYESGKNRIAASRLYELSKILKVSPHFFFEGLCRDEYLEGRSIEEDKITKTVDRISKIKNEKIKNGIFDIILGLEE